MHSANIIHEHTLFKDVLMSYPAIMDVPDVMEMSPVKILKVVVLPAPLTPSKPKHSPFGRPRLIPSTAFLEGMTLHPER